MLQEGGCFPKLSPQPLTCAWNKCNCPKALGVPRAGSATGLTPQPVSITPKFFSWPAPCPPLEQISITHQLIPLPGSPERPLIIRHEVSVPSTVLSAPAGTQPPPGSVSHILSDSSVSAERSRKWAASVNSRCLAPSSSPHTHSSISCSFSKKHEALGNSGRRQRSLTRRICVQPGVCGGSRDWGGEVGTEQVRRKRSHLVISLGSSISRSLRCLPHILSCGWQEINICKYHFPRVALALNPVD